MPAERGSRLTPNVAGRYLNNPRIRNLLYQLILAAVLVWVGYTLFANTTANLERQGIVSGFRFMQEPAGFDITQTLIPYNESMSYGRAFLVGLLNTLLVGVLGVFFATILGFLIGVGRLSSNWIVAKVCGLYVEIIRNLPLLLQIFIWYFSVLRLLPSKRDSLDMGSLGYLNLAGWFMPQPVFDSSFWLVIVAAIAAIVLTVAVSMTSRRLQERSGKRLPAFWIGAALIVGLPSAVFFLSGMPLTFDPPSLGRFGPRGGIQVTSEFIGLLVALITYTAAFIAENRPCGHPGGGRRANRSGPRTGSAQWPHPAADHHSPGDARHHPASDQ